MNVWAVFVGVAQGIEDYRGHRASPNCVLCFDPAKGFNSDSLSVVISQRNGVGVAPDAQLFLNFGLDFDFEAARLSVARDDKVVRGALDLFFESQKAHLAEEAARNAAESQQEAAEAAEKAEAAARLSAAAAEKAEAEEEQRKKTEEAAAAEEAAKSAAQQKKKQEAEDLKRALADENSDAAKRRKAFTTIYTSPKGFRLAFCEDELVLFNDGSTNLKIAKDTIVAQWTNETLLKRGSEGFAYSLTNKSIVYDAVVGKKMTLEKLIKDKYPSTKSIFKYKPFPPGVVPKVLLPEVDGKKYQFDSKAENKDQILKCVELLRIRNTVSLAWQTTYNANHERVQPQGLVALADAAMVVPGDGELVLNKK